MNIEHKNTIAVALGALDGGNVTEPYTWETDIVSVASQESKEIIEELNRSEDYALTMGFWEAYEHGYSLSAQGE